LPFPLESRRRSRHIGGMAYRFTLSDETLTAGARRIAAGQIAAAIRAVDTAAQDPVEAVHDVRKRCKKLRGLVRLIRPGFAAYAEENVAYRDIGRSLSGARDADARIETYDRLAKYYAGQIDRSATASVRRRLTLDRKAADPEGAEHALAEVRQALEAARARAASWQVEGSAQAVLTQGLRKSYARGGKAMKQAGKRGDVDSFHDWRKRCKYHRQHLRLLRAAWPKQIEARAEAAKTLADMLGMHHDLADLREPLVAEPDRYGGIRDIELLVGLIDRRQAALEREAMALGARLFADAPDALAARMGAYWRAWREGGEPRSDALAG
jgi:CHAD domain-containing protein